MEDPVKRVLESQVVADAPGRPRWSIVIPCFRSGPWLLELVEAIESEAAPWLADLELILVDDDSGDDATWPAIEKAAARHPWVRGLQLQFNVGQFRALTAGLAASRGDWVVTMDDDWQTHPRELPKLFAAAAAHPELDAIIGRYPAKHHSRARNLGTRLVGWIQDTVYDRPAGLETTSYRILGRALVDTIAANRSVDPSFPAIILRSTRRIMNIDLEHAPRRAGRSGYSWARLVELVAAQIFNASTFPLRVVSLLGITVSLASVAFGAWSFGKWLNGTIQEPGFTTIVLLITLLLGVVLLALGVIGEYLIRVVIEVRGTPRYVVRSTTEVSKAGDAAYGDGTQG